MIRKMSTSIIACLLLSSCASLEGIPQGLSAEDRTDISSGDLARAFKAADNLSSTYAKARNENLRYAFWSNVPFVPLAAGSAAAIYSKASKDVLATIGIVAGSLIGFNSLINARSNEKSYGSGIAALLCLQTNLEPYVKKNTRELDDKSGALIGLIESAKETLEGSQNVLSAENADAEISANQKVVGTFASNQKDLSQAITDAQAAVGAAENEVGLFDTLPIFVANGIRQIDATVANKVGQGDISYSGLVTSISASTTPPAPPHSAAPPDKSKANSETPVADSAKALLTTTTDLKQATAEVVSATKTFGLTAQEQTVSTCIKAI